MAIYEYCCQSCNNKFEMKRPMSESDKDAECPACKGKAKRALSKFACFSTDSAGVPTTLGGTGGGCGGCSSSSCATCGG
jgi:putative FmdB family regulatory protein